MHSVCMAKQLHASVGIYTYMQHVQKKTHGDMHTHTDLYIPICLILQVVERFSVSDFHTEGKDFLNRVSFSKPEDVMSGFRTIDRGHF